MKWIVHLPAALLRPVFKQATANKTLITKTLLVMKLTVLLFFMATFCVQATGVAQSNVTLNVQNMPVKEFLTLLKKQTGVPFIYNMASLKNTHPVTIKVKDIPLTQILDISLKEQGLEYEIEKGYIIIRKKENVQPQPQAAPSYDSLITLAGKVVNEKNEPIPGVSISVNGSSRNTITDEDGNFSFNRISPGAVLTANCINCKTSEIPVNNRRFIQIALQAAIGKLEAVTINVNTGFQSLSKERVTGSFYKLDNEIINRKVSSDIISRLEHQTSGFQIYQNQLSVRGRSTIFANQNPLIIVDNFPYDGKIENLNPADVESITILKDAAAASIWGTLSGNGVIVITTKKGRYQQPTRIDVLSNITIGQKPDLYYNPAFLNTTDFIGVEQYLFAQGFYDNDLNNTTTYPAMSPVVKILAQARAGTISSADATAQIEALKKYDYRNELSTHFYQKSVAQQYALNITGGAEKASYYMSVGYDKLLSNLKTNQNNRVTINAQVSVIPAKNLELSGGINYIQSINNSGNPAGSSIGALTKTLYPYARLADENGNPLPLAQKYDNSYTNAMQGRGLLDWQYYPLAELGLNKSTTTTNETRLNAGIKYTIIQGLSIELKYQHQKSLEANNLLNDQNSYFTRDLINQFTTINTDGSIKRNVPLGSILNNTNSNLLSNAGRAQLNFTKTIHLHNITAVAGFDVKEIQTRTIQNLFYGYDANTLTFGSVNYDSTYKTTPGGGLRKIPFNAAIGGILNRFRSYFANAAYTFKNRYSFSLSGRIDQSNFFGYQANKRSVPLWSTGIKWDISKEEFYHLGNLLEQLSFRTTYGVNGNLDRKTSPLTLARYASNANNTGAAYGTISKPGNPELRWEKIKMLNVGIDFAFRKNILSGSVEYYYKNGKDMIGDDPLDPTTGFYYVTGNFSDMKGSGFDVVLNSSITDRKFKWNVNALFSYTTNKVVKYKGTSAAASILEGKPVSSTYSQKWGGLDPTNGDPRGYLADTLSKAYGIINNQPLKDQVYNGSSTPTVFGSILNSFSFQNFSFSINISYKTGYYFHRSALSYSALFNTYTGHQEYTQRWQKKGDELHTNVPSLVYPINTNRDAFYINSEATIEKGNHIRLEDIRLSYNVNKHSIPSLKNLQVYAFVNNIGTLWRSNSKGIDPNYVSAGYLPPVTFTFGFRAGL